MKLLMEVMLSLALVGGWAIVAVTASRATQTETAASVAAEAAAAVGMAAAVSAPTS